MRPHLTRSFIFVLGFWWLILAFKWSVSDPEENLNSLRAVLQLFPFLNLTLPEHVTVLDAWAIQKAVLKYWTFWILCATAAVTLVGAGVVWLYALRQQGDRDNRVKSQGEYRGVRLSLGTLPTPTAISKEPLSLKGAEGALSKLSEIEQVLLGDVLGLLAGHPEVYQGESGDNNLERALRLANQGLSHKHHPGLAAIAAACSELGKLTAWVRDDSGQWIQRKPEEREAARILAGLTTWWQLPFVERMGLLFAVKYRGKPQSVPDITREPRIYRLARDLLSSSAEAIVEVAEAARQEVFEQREPKEAILETFVRELAMLPFQSPGLPKNIPAVGWKKGNRAFFLENRLCEAILAKLDPELRAAFTSPTREKSPKVSLLGQEFLKIFEEKGWLVCKEGTQTVPPHEALWVIQAGKLEFSRVIILDLPEEMVERLPSRDSYYDVVIKRPLFAIAGNISKDDLFGGLLKPKNEGAESSGVAHPKSETLKPAGSSTKKPGDPLNGILK
jgi:hypothetical protein